VPKIVTWTAPALKLTKRHSAFWSKTRVIRTTSMAMVTAWRVRNYYLNVLTRYDSVQQIASTLELKVCL
jgi:hypothetical protein